MKKILKPMLFVTALGLVTFASCKKKTDDSPQAKLKGKWKIVKLATDDNGNGVMDANEIETLSDSITAIVTFNGDATGSNYYELTGSSTTTENFTWSLMNNNTDLSLVYTSGSSVGDVYHTHIESLSGSDMTLKDTSSYAGVVYTTWGFYKKQ